MNRSIGKSPFEIDYGLHPRGFFELRDLEDGIHGIGYAEEFSQSMREIHESVRKILTKNADN